AFWQRRCRAAAAEAVLKPLGGNCAVLPYTLWMVQIRLSREFTVIHSYFTTQPAIQPVFPLSCRCRR
ncbi:hypothetical protein, partial [Gemmiger sp.]|uniref:hypothetical protein n=1 Tax=Gemmiger sp. TaxID=2049027 RepID=UPI0025C3F781